jgi:hypothetical protein
LTDKKTEDPKDKDSTSTQDEKDSDKSKSKENNGDKDSEISIPKSRFDEVNSQLKDTKKQLEKIQKEREEAEKKKLEEQNEFKELYEKANGELESLRDSLKRDRKKSAIRTEATKAGVLPDALDDVVNLIDLDSISLDEDNNPTNVTDVIKTFVLNKPYLLTDQGRKNIGSDTSGAGDGRPKTGKIWKQSEVLKLAKNNKWWEENKEEINKAKAEGRYLFKE